MKRPHNAPKAAHKAHKRQKVEKAPQPPSNKPKRKVQLHELGWKNVSMPDRLEDFEGFYGLEEIDDVAMVKDEKTGRITFETTKTEEEVEQAIEDTRKYYEEEAQRLEDITFGAEADDGSDEEEGAKVDDEEWEGFSDGDAPAKVAPVKKSKAAAKKEAAAAAAAATAPAANGEVKVPKTAEEKKKRVEEKKKRQAEARLKKQEAREAEEAKAKLAAKEVEVDDEEEDDEEEEDEVEKDEEEQVDAEDDDEEDDAEDVEDLSETETLGQGAFDILANQPDDDDDQEVDVSAWSELDLSTEMLDALAKMKFSKPTTIQAATIPEIMAGRDVIGKASTGSGKTLAFGIPIIEAILAARLTAKDSKEKTPTALIVSPTRELAHQITEHLTALCAQGEFDPPFITSVTGGLSVQKQRRQLEKADIVVGTPGRLWEVISSGQGLMAAFKKIQFLVVDEADRLLSQGHYKELGEILKILERGGDTEGGAEPTDDPAPAIERQTLVFSATFQKNLQQKLAGKAAKGGGDLLNKQQSMEYLLKKLSFREEKPKFIDANPTSQMASGLREGLIECAGTEKDLYLYSLLLFHPNKRALIFTNSISAVRRLTPYLVNLNLPAVPLHSNMPQKARLRSIERFKERPGSILVATDVAARGLDIPKVELVVHYHLPRAADTYVHRSGRTARADALGSSILICAPSEVAGVRRLVAKVHARSTNPDGTAPKNKKTAFYIRTLDIDRRIVARLKPRATLSKALADAVIAKEKENSKDDVLRQGADDLGIDYDAEEFQEEAKGKRGRGTGRKKKEREAREITRAELQGMRAELRSLLSERINTGVSAKYLTSGGIDVDALMAGEGNLGFLGNVDGLGFEDGS